MIFKIIVKNLLYKPLNTALSVALLSLSVGIIALLLVLQHQVERKFQNDLKDIDVVMGAKGSPLQLVLSAVYHIDAPTGNISSAEMDKLRRNTFVKQVIPLAYGDSYQSYRILGTDTTYVHKYEGKLAEGRMFKAKMEAVLGSQVARKSGLKPGATFYGTHGMAQEGEVHDAAAYTVVGVLTPGNSVLDNLVLTNVASVWAVHGEEGHEHETGEHHESHGHGADDHHGHNHEAEKTASSAVEQELTALLVKCKSPMGTLTLPRMINEGTSMQAAVPALEINRLFNLMGLGVATIQALAFAIMLISGFSVFIALYNRLKERRYELALLRSMGCSRIRLFMLLISEGLLLALFGFAGGFLLCRLGIWVLNRGAAQDFHHSFSYSWVGTEAWLFALTIGIGFMAALIPAVKAFKMNLSTTLADA